MAHCGLVLFYLLSKVFIFIYFLFIFLIVISEDTQERGTERRRAKVVMNGIVLGDIGK